MKNKYIVVILILIVATSMSFYFGRDPVVIVTNFEECAVAGNAVMESYPRQCRHGDETFVENIGNELEKIDLIRINSPRPNQEISSPLAIYGEAIGTWFFEADFPIALTNLDGLIIAEGFATAKTDWMTEEFVQFEATLTFDVDIEAFSNKGYLILQKDNPSDLPENDDALKVPVVFSTISDLTNHGSNSY